MKINQYYCAPLVPTVSTILYTRSSKLSDIYNFYFSETLAYTRGVQTVGGGGCILYKFQIIFSPKKYFDKHIYYLNPPTHQKKI